MGTTEYLVSSDEYGKLDTKAKRIIVLDYFFRKYNEFKDFTYLKPKDLKSEYKLTVSQKRTLNRHFEWLYRKYLLIGETENIDTSKTYNTSFKIRTKEDDSGVSFKFNIPTDPFKRKHYATLLIGLLYDSDDVASQIPFFNETAEMGMKFITQLTDGVVRDVYLASKVYEYFKCNSGNLLNIVAELSHYKQPIWIKFNDSKKIESGIIESIGIYEDGEIELIINDETIVLKNIDDIKNIFILSSNFPTSDVAIGRPSDGKQRYHKRPSMNAKILLDSLKTQKNYTKMVEIYAENCKDDDVTDDSLEEFIKRISKPTKDCLTLSERANRRIKIITEE